MGKMLFGIAVGLPLVILIAVYLLLAITYKQAGRAYIDAQYTYRINQ